MIKFSESWLAVFYNFISDQAYFKLYPILDWEPIKFFKWGIIWENLHIYYT